MSPTPHTEPLGERELQQVFIETRGELERTIHRRVRDRDYAQDLAQDLFFRLTRLAGKLPNASEARFYLLRMAHNIGKDHVRLTQNRARLLEGLVVLYDQPPETQDEALETRQRLEIVEAAMAQLSERQRDMLRRSRILGEDYRTIAAEWRCSVSTVEQEIARALKLTRKRVQGL